MEYLRSIAGLAAGIARSIPPFQSNCVIYGSIPNIIVSFLAPLTNLG
jgi:hypothetical protein